MNAFSWEGVGEKKKNLTIPVLPKDMNWRESMQILRIFCKQSINLKKKKTFQSTANICILSHQFRSLGKTMIVRVFFHPPLFPPPKKKKRSKQFFFKVAPIFKVAPTH